MDTYDTNKTDHDKRFDTQKGLMQLLKESEKFEIYESYTNEALRQTSQQLQDMVERLKNSTPWCLMPVTRMVQ